MNSLIKAGARWGSVHLPCSKSEAHRALIAAALSKSPSLLKGADSAQDIIATSRCLNALGASVAWEMDGSLSVIPIRDIAPGLKQLYPGESGSTLRFLLPLVGALGVEACFHMEGRLPERPLGALTDALKRHGMLIEKHGAELKCKGRLDAGEYSVPGNVSSQFITGLLFALPLLNGKSVIRITGPLESRDYVLMTLSALRAAGINVQQSGDSFAITGPQAYLWPQESTLERDWSGAAFFLCMGALSDRGIRVPDLTLASSQGDKAVLDILKRAGAFVTADISGVTVKRGELRGLTVDASGVPDLVPALSALFSVANGVTRIVNAGRLRLKESDRLLTTQLMLSRLGADIAIEGDGLVIRGKNALNGGTVDAQGDHRIAMAAAVAASRTRGDVTVKGAECVSKSFPRFWNELNALEVNQ